MARFDGVDDYLGNASTGLVATGYPFTVGFWFYVTSFAGTPTLWIYGDTASVNARFNISITATGQVQIVCKDSGAQAFTNTTGTVSAGTWNFVVGRFISATNRRLSVLFANGTIEHIQNTTSKSPLSCTTITIGAFRNTSVTAFLDGQIRKAWWTDTDIQAGGGQLDDTILRRLAYGGPFSLPHVAQALVEYHELGSTIPGVLADEEDYGRSRFSWTNNGGVSLGSEAPVPVWHERPLNRSSLVMI